MFKSKLKSELDLSFANVNLAQARLLLLDAQNNENAALAAFPRYSDFPACRTFNWRKIQPPITPPPGNVEDLISTAFAMRPEILALQFQV